MIYVDSREGSKDLLAPLKTAGLPVELTLLKFGDIAFEGRGEGGTPLSIGVEHKKIPDLIQSLEGRLPGHQLPGMVNTYDRRWLIVEGDWTHDTQGRTAMFKGRGARKPMKGAPPAIELEKRLLTLETRGGIAIRICPDRRDTVRFLTALYRFWTDKNLDAHKSHLAMYAPDLDRGIFNPPSDFRKALSVLLPGVSSAVSQAIEEECGGAKNSTRAKLVEMLSWNLKAWADLITVSNNGKARRLGESRAAHIVEALK